MAFFDQTNNIGNQKSATGHVVHFVHVPTRQTCHFKAFLTSWDDQFKQEWKEYATVGRMDSIRLYSRTSRIISFSLDIPSADFEEALFNMSEVEKLIQMSYPTFTEEKIKIKGTDSQADGKSTSGPSGTEQNNNTNLVTGNNNVKEATISRMISPPFFRVKFDNWINDPSLDSQQVTNDAVESGLYGTLESVRFTPDLSDSGGGFYGSDSINKLDYDEERELLTTKNGLIPKLLKLDIFFTVLHTNKLGYNSNSKKLRTENGSFPYNANNLYKKKYKVSD